MTGELTKEIVDKTLLSQKWIFAKTMTKYPHWYTLKKSWADPLLFEGIVQYIRDNSYTEYFLGKKYQMYLLAGHKYWTMGSPINQTILINRASK